MQIDPIDATIAELHEALADPVRLRRALHAANQIGHIMLRSQLLPGDALVLAQFVLIAAAHHPGKHASSDPALLAAALHKHLTTCCRDALATVKATFDELENTPDEPARRDGR